jgi:hypothetical protein
MDMPAIFLIFFFHCCLPLPQLAASNVFSLVTLAHALAIHCCALSVAAFLLTAGRLAAWPGGALYFGA